MQCSKQDWLTLVRTQGVGSKTLLPLVRQSGNLQELFFQAPEKVSTRLEQSFQQSDDNHSSEQVEKDIAWLETPGNHLIPISDPLYPELLKQIDDPPVVLFVHGQAELLCMPQLAIVGSRNPTKSGRDNAYAFARHLSESGLVITSGMALGIDAQAHIGSLSVNGNTLAVTGTGTDRVYPASHHKLAHQIAEQGAIVSEFPPGTEPRPGHFPRRNRIISGMSLGTLVVEATIKSGSLITAHQAMEQGREVFAIPGSIHNPQSKGCHKLIREGAKLAECGQDIIDELGSLLSSLLPGEMTVSADNEPAGSELDSDYLFLLEQMGWDPVSAEQLINITKFPPESVSSMLLLLELQGHVSTAPGGLYCRTIPSI